MQISTKGHAAVPIPNVGKVFIILAMLAYTDLDQSDPISVSGSDIVIILLSDMRQMSPMHKLI